MTYNDIVWFLVVGIVEIFLTYDNGKKDSMIPNNSCRYHSIKIPSQCDIVMQVCTRTYHVCGFV